MAGVKYTSTAFWKGERVVRSIGPSSRRGVTLALLRLKSLAVPLAPKDTGAIDPEGYLVFDTPYAAIQHEDLDYHHDEGQAHYVSEPLAKNQAELVAIVGGEVRVGIIRS